MTPLAIVAWIWKGIGWLLDILGIPRWAPLAALGGVLMLTGAYWKGHHDAAQDCQEATLRTKIAGLERDVQNEKDARAEEERLSAALELQRQQLSIKVADYAAALRSRPDAKCALTEEDVKALSPSRRRK